MAGRKNGWLFNITMNKIIYKIITPYGGIYETDGKGRVIKCSNGLNKEKSSEKELNSWKITGIREIKPFNNLGMLIPLSEAVKITNFLRKNGNPRYAIEDIDHGTRRIHGNYKYHGVKCIYLI